MSSVQVKCSLVKLADGQEAIGSNAHDLLDALLPKSTRGKSIMLSSVKDAVEKLPDPSTDSADEITLDMIGSVVESQANWMDRVTDMAMNTTDIFKDLQGRIRAMPSQSPSTQALKRVYDTLLIGVNRYEDSLLEQTKDYNLGMLTKLGIDGSVMDIQDWTSAWEDKEQPQHQTLTTVLKQYIGNLWTERYADSVMELMQEQETRLALHFNYSAEDIRTAVNLMVNKAIKSRFEEQNHADRERSQRQLNDFSEKIGIPSGIFENDPVSWVPLGEYAPTTTAWKSAVMQKWTGERTTLEILKDWPGTEAYVASHSEAAPKKKKKKRSKKKKASQASEATTVVNESNPSESNDMTPTAGSVVEEVIEEEPEEGKDTPSTFLSVPAARKVKTSKSKPRGHRQNRFEQMMISAARNGTRSSGTEKTTPSAPVVSEDWATIRKQVQEDFKSMSARLTAENTRWAQEIKKDKEHLSKLIADNAPSNIASQMTGASQVIGRRAGRRAPYAPARTSVAISGYSRRAPLITSTKSKTGDSKPAKDFDASAVTWPALEVSEDTTSKAQEEEIAVPANRGDAEEAEMSDPGDSLSVDLQNYSTAGVEPEVVAMVEMYLPKLEEGTGASGLSVAEAVSILGGWEAITKAYRESEVLAEAYTGLPESM